MILKRLLLPQVFCEKFIQKKKEINLKSKLWNHYKHGGHVYTMLSAFPEEAVCGLCCSWMIIWK